MKVENAVTTSVEISSLGTHRFLDEFALAYHRAVAERLRREPQTVISHARQNLNRWIESAAFGDGEVQTLEEWQGILDGSDVDGLIEIITDISDEGQRLRSSSPFVGTLSPEKRMEILTACEQRATA
jgi:hypothetical protein